MTREAGNRSQLASAVNLDHTLNPGDLGAIISLHGTVYAQEYGLDSSFEAYVAGPLADFATKGPDAGRLWIARCGDQIVGCIAIVGTSLTEAQLRWFLIHPAFRGLGLGKRLMQEAVEFCRSRGY